MTSIIGYLQKSSDISIKAKLAWSFSASGEEFIWKNDQHDSLKFLVKLLKIQMKQKSKMIRFIHSEKEKKHTYDFKFSSLEAFEFVKNSYVKVTSKNKNNPSLSTSSGEYNHSNGLLGIGDIVKQLIDEQQKLQLSTDPALAASYRQLVIDSKTLSIGEFWKQRKQMYQSEKLIHNNAKSSNGSSSINLTRPMLQYLFNHFPRLKHMHSKLVPVKMTDSVFFSKFFHALNVQGGNVKELLTRLASNSEKFSLILEEGNDDEESSNETIINNTELKWNLIETNYDVLSGHDNKRGYGSIDRENSAQIKTNNDTSNQHLNQFKMKQKSESIIYNNNNNNDLTEYDNEKNGELTDLKLQVTSNDSNIPLIRIHQDYYNSIDAITTNKDNSNKRKEPSTKSAPITMYDTPVQKKLRTKEIMKQILQNKKIKYASVQNPSISKDIAKDLISIADVVHRDKLKGKLDCSEHLLETYGAEFQYIYKSKHIHIQDLLRHYFALLSINHKSDEISVKIHSVAVELNNMLQSLEEESRSNVSIGSIKEITGPLKSQLMHALSFQSNSSKLHGIPDIAPVLGAQSSSTTSGKRTTTRYQNRTTDVVDLS